MKKQKKIANLSKRHLKKRNDIKYARRSEASPDNVRKAEKKKMFQPYKILS